ncbi:hypothetical protein [Planococcus lenghuensis]|nr:hypothetical protein [Planococcus lenghuensis]
MMENDFFKELLQAAGIDVVMPDQVKQHYLHGKTLSELEKGIVEPETKK